MHAFFIGINSKYIHTALGIRYVTEYSFRPDPYHGKD